MTDLPMLRRELLALLADLDSDFDEIQEKVEAIIGEIERRTEAGDDRSQGRPK